MSEPENMVLVLLREMRAEQAAGREELLREIRASEDRANARFDAIEKQLEKMRANGLRAMATFVGHRNMTERAFGSFEKDLAEHGARLDKLESAR